MMITNVADRVGVGEHFNPFVTWNGKASESRVVASMFLGRFKVQGASRGAAVEASFAL
ncbi:hypothetical protein PIB30_046277 [Stylosanthes scabra]|uniref:Uncharacterized protein n=1 Tax=Stylosanthes scabra TaxID=79078 RepID=A0ABU6ZF59_9FABA|nr:hypothetical protein [Stylosanthes scabra]